MTRLNRTICEIDERELEDIIVAAYQRGAHWAYENSSADDKSYLGKASLDYADKTISVYKGAGLESSAKSEEA